MKIAVLPGDGIGAEIVVEAIKVLQALDLKLELEQAPVGGTAYAQTGDPLPPQTLALAKAADAILFGAVGDPRYDNIERAKRPEQAILGLRKALGLFANLRPATVHPELADASTIRADVVAGLDLRAARVNKRGGVDAEATSSNAKSSLSLSHSKILMENPCRRHPSKMAQPFWLLAARGQSPTRC